VAWWCAAQGAALVHAAAVAPPGRPDRGLLLVGAGGAGKSTLALACGLAGWTVTADDYLVLSSSSHGPAPSGPWRAAAPYRWAKADPDARTRLGLPEAWLVPGVDHLGKALVDLPTAFGAAGAASCAITAAVVPGRAERTASAVAVAGVALVAAAGPSTVLQTPGDGQGVLRVLGELGRAVPTYRLPLGPDVARTGPAALAELAEALEARATSEVVAS
jgi:hypothetical protein